MGGGRENGEWDSDSSYPPDFIIRSALKRIPFSKRTATYNAVEAKPRSRQLGRCGGGNQESWAVMTGMIECLERWMKKEGGRDPDYVL